MSLSTVEPSDIEDIGLQEDSNEEVNKDNNRKVISHCEGCEKEVSNTCEIDPLNFSTAEPFSTEDIIARCDNCDNHLTHIC